MNEYLQKFRAEHPEYNDLSDGDLAKAIHGKFYSDIPFSDFAQRIGLMQDQQEPQRSTALDAFVALANGVGLGIPAAVSKDTRAYLKAAKAQHPKTMLAAGVAGSAIPALLSLGGTLEATAGTEATPLMRSLLTGKSMASAKAGGLFTQALKNPAVRKEVVRLIGHAASGVGGGYAFGKINGLLNR